MYAYVMLNFQVLSNRQFTSSNEKSYHLLLVCILACFTLYHVTLCIALKSHCSNVYASILFPVKGFHMNAYVYVCKYTVQCTEKLTKYSQYTPTCVSWRCFSKISGF